MAKVTQVPYTDGRPRRRKTARWRGTFRQVCNSLARSTGLYRGMRWLTGLVMLSGLCLLAWGMLASIGSFSADATTLINFAGDGGSVVDATVGFAQSEALRMVGLAPASASAGEGAAADGGVPVDQGQVPVVQGTPDATPSWEQGFLPYQIPVSAVNSQHAPAVPMIPVSGQASAPTQPPAQPVDPSLAEMAAAPTATAEPVPPTPLPPADPDRIVIPNIGLDAPVVVAPLQTTTVSGQAVEQWQAPNFFAGGWQQGSARLGEKGNTVINGHHNIYGEVFAHLRDLQQGDEIDVYSGETPYRYVVSQVMKLRERDMPLDQRLENARWVLPSEDERLTLVTCWPPVSNTYRLIVVAVPAGAQ